MSTATVTLAGRAFMALALKSQPLHVAWGTGDPAWDGMPDAELPGLAARTALFGELGRRSPATVGFVVPDEDGGISIPVGQDGKDGVIYTRYRQVDEPSAWLYLRANFDNADAADSIIREMALFGGTVVKPDLPPGQLYFRPDELETPGFLVAMEIVRPSFPRSPSVRESYEFVFPV